MDPSVKCVRLSALERGLRLLGFAPPGNASTRKEEVVRMKRRCRTLVRWTGLVGLVVVLGGCSLFGPPAPQPPAAGADEVVGIVEVDGMPAVRLGDGRTFFLDRLEDWEEYDRRFAPSPNELAVLSDLSPASLPASVDLRSYQTPIKEQWGPTCVQFAVTAAIEARLRRVYTGILDLSERFGQLLQKMSHLEEANQPQAGCRENQLGAWGGGNVYYQLKLFTKYRLPLESHLPYSTIVGTTLRWEDDRCAPATGQRAMDDYNLSSTNLPLVALQNARFRAQEVRFCPDGSLRDPAWYERVLADGYEIVFGASLCGADPTPGNGVWDPGPGTACDGHAMLMVGYRHDQRVFIVKNSWGYNHDHGEDGFTLMSYDWVTGGYVGSAGYILSVAADAPYPFIEHLALGRWYLDHDGWTGILDIYRWPGLFEASALNGAQDRRIGTYWGSDGVARRVNGTVDGHKVEFYIDWDNPNLGYGDLRGMKFTGYLFTQAPTVLAGLMVDSRDGGTYGFYGAKDGWRVGTPAGGTLRPESYLGRWSLVHDGWRGTLVFSRVGQPMAVDPKIVIDFVALEGTYTPAGGSPVPASAQVRIANPQDITFWIHFADGDVQTFRGRLFGHEQGIMAGTTDWGGATYGFMAVRQAVAP